MPGAVTTLGLGVSIVRVVALVTGQSTLAAILGVSDGEAKTVLERLKDRAGDKAVVRAGELVAERFDRFLDVEFRDAQPHDRAAAVADLSEFLEQELAEPQRLVDAVRGDDELRTFLMQNGGEARASALGGLAGEIFQFLLDKTANEVKQLAPTSSKFQPAALNYLVRAVDVVSDDISELIDRPLDGVVAADAVAFADKRVRELAPAELKDREAELDRMDDFARHGPGQWWSWEAPMQAGKTALMATYASQRHPGVQVVPFFVRRDRASSRDRQSFLGEVCPRLAHIANQRYAKSIAPNPVQAEHEFHALLRQAARACQDGPRPRQLLLLIDGLDEDDWYVDPRRRTGSIASLLPAQPPENVRIVVACRPNPPLPEDVLPGDEASPDRRHPLRDCSKGGPWHALGTSPHARQSFDRNDVVDFMSSQVGKAVAAYLVAAGGPLSVASLTQLTQQALPDVTEAEVRSRITTTSGRLLIPVATDPTRPHVTGYEPGHARIGQYVLTVLDPNLIDYGPDPDDAAAWHAHTNRLLGPWRDSIREWARSYADEHWPDTTPDYLLEPAYVKLLTQEAASRRALVDVLTDPARNSRIRTRTGSFAPALAQQRTVVNGILAPTPHDTSAEPIDLEHIGRLLFAIHDLTREVGRVPAQLPSVFARAGEDRQAERLIDATEDPFKALVRMACAYLDTAALTRCTHAASRALQRLTHDTRFSPDRAETCAQLARIFAQAGDIDSARTATDAIPVSADDHQNTLTAAVIAHAVCQQAERALEVAGFLDPYTRIRALAEAAWECHRAGNTANALTLAAETRGLADTLDINTDALARTVRLYADIGQLERARSIAAELQGPARLRQLAGLAVHLLDQDDRDTAGQIALLAATDLAGADPFFASDTLSSLAAVLIETGYGLDSQPVLQACAGRIRTAGHARLAAAHYASHQPHRAREHLDTALTNAEQQQGWLRVYDLEKLLDPLLAVAPTDVLDELIPNFMQAVASDPAGTYVRNSGARMGARLAHIGRLSDALHLTHQLQGVHEAFADEITLAIAHALAASGQWQQTLNVLNTGKFSARDVTTVADALARHGHLDLALAAANQALQTSAPSVHAESLTEVAHALASVGHLPAALKVISEDSEPRRYDGYFSAADAAARHDRAEAIRTIESLVPEHPGSIALLTGLANAALSEDRLHDASPLLARAANLVRQQPNHNNVHAAINIACLQAYAKEPEAAFNVIRSSVSDEERYHPLARVAAVLDEIGRADDADAAATLALNQVTNISDVRKRIHSCASLTKLLTPSPGLSERAQSAANAARVAFEQLRPFTALDSDAARSSLSHTASAVAAALALTGQSAAAVQICTEIRNHGCEPLAFDVAPALAAGGDLPAALELIQQLNPSNQAQPLERVIAALTKTPSPDSAFGAIAMITDPGQRSAAFNHLAAAEALQGHPRDAHRHTREAITLATQACPYVPSEQLLSSAGTLQRIGEQDEARETVLEAARASQVQHAHISGTVLLGCAQLMHRLDDGPSSRRFLAESWVADGHPLNGWTLLVELNPDIAVALAKRRWPKSLPISLAGD